MKYIDLKAVLNITGLSRSVLYSKLAKENFPKPIEPMSSKILWKYSDIQNWIKSRMKERDDNFNANNLGDLWKDIRRLAHYFLSLL